MLTVLVICILAVNVAVANVVPKPSPETIRKCSRKATTGVCQAAINKYYYNTDTKRCEQFIYGGCGGNDNRFNNEQECSQTCRNLDKFGCTSWKIEDTERGEENCGTIEIMDEKGCFNTYVNCPHLNRNATDFQRSPVPPDCRQRYLKRPRRPAQIVTDCTNEENPSVG